MTRQDWLTVEEAMERIDEYDEWFPALADRIRKMYDQEMEMREKEKEYFSLREYLLNVPYMGRFAPIYYFIEAILFGIAKYRYCYNSRYF